MLMLNFCPCFAKPTMSFWIVFYMVWPQIVLHITVLLACEKYANNPYHAWKYSNTVVPLSFWNPVISKQCGSNIAYTQYTMPDVIKYSICISQCFHTMYIITAVYVTNCWLLFTLNWWLYIHTYVGISDANICPYFSICWYNMSPVDNM